MFIVNCQQVGRSKLFVVSFLYNEEMVKFIKELPRKTYKWDNKNKFWIIEAYSLFLLISKYKGSTRIKFDFNEKDREQFIKKVKIAEEKNKLEKEELKKLEKYKKKWLSWKKEVDENYNKYYEITHKNLRKGVKLYPHQIAAVMYMNEVKRVLIAHDMGLGKTLEAIAFVEMNSFKKVFVITPNSLKFNFFNEVEKFTNSKVHILNWRHNKFSLEDSKYIIVNYDFFRNKQKDFEKKWEKVNINKIDVLILDEAQKIKNSKTNTYKNFKRTFKDKIFNGFPYRIYLTGTPAPNRAYELYNILHDISPLEFKTKEQFYRYYCGMVYDQENGWGYQKLDIDHFDELYNNIQPYIHRKKKEDVLNLPEKVYQKIILEMSSSEYDAYLDIEEDAADDFLFISNLNPLTKLLYLRQYTSHLKYESTIEMIDNILEYGEKIVIVDIFKKTIISLYEKYKNIAVLHTGDATPEERNEMIKQFQDPNSEIKLFFATIQTANYGLTLTAASKLILLTLPFSAGRYDQVTDRLHRIGQKNTVNIYIMTYKNTIDEYTYDSVEDKKKEIKKAIDNEEYSSDINESVMHDVINKIEEKYKKHGAKN